MAALGARVAGRVFVSMREPIATERSRALGHDSCRIRRSVLLRRHNFGFLRNLRWCCVVRQLDLRRFDVRWRNRRRNHLGQRNGLGQRNRLRQRNHLGRQNHNDNR
jgi:hypothetical protein